MPSVNLRGMDAGWVYRAKLRALELDLTLKEYIRVVVDADTSNAGSIRNESAVSPVGSGSGSLKL